jgi:hypothetical protein
MTSEACFRLGLSPIFSCYINNRLKGTKNPAAHQMRILLPCPTLRRLNLGIKSKYEEETIERKTDPKGI